MSYRKGDIIAISNSDAVINIAVVIQADWFNVGGPPSYIVSLLSDEVYPELDFRPMIEPDSKNKLPTTLQSMVDKIQVIKSTQVVRKIGEINNHQIAEINGCVKAILGL